MLEQGLHHVAEVMDAGLGDHGLHDHGLHGEAGLLHGGHEGSLPHLLDPAHHIVGAYVSTNCILYLFTSCFTTHCHITSYFILSIAQIWVVDFFLS